MRASSTPWSSIIAATMMCLGVAVLAWPTDRATDSEAWATGLELMVRLSVGGVLACVGLIWFVLSSRSVRAH